MDRHNKVLIESDGNEVSASPKESVRVLAFRLGGERYCVDINQAKSVVNAGSVTRVPNMPAFVAGIMNLRGDVISLIDIRHFFGLDTAKRARQARILVTDAAGSPCGIVVDSIDEAIDIDLSSIQPPLATLKGRAGEFTKGQVQLGGDILVMLDLKKILCSEEIGRLRKGE